jgi:hypothetical protein
MPSLAKGPLRVTRGGRIPRVGRPGPDTLDYLFRNVGVSKRRVMEELAPYAAEFEPRILPAVKRWLELSPWQRRFVTLDDLADGAGLTRGEFVAAIARASFEFTGSITDLIVAAALPDMVATAVRRALMPEGFEDRIALLAHAGFFDDTKYSPLSEYEPATLRLTSGLSVFTCDTESY